MKEITIYLVELFLVSTLFFICYLWVKDHSTPSFRRVLLLCWLISSFVFPLVTIDGFVYSVPKISYSNFEPIGAADESPTPLESRNEIPSYHSNNQAVIPLENSSIPSSPKDVSYENYIVTIYWAVAIFLFIKLLFGLVQIVVMKRNARKQYIDGRSVYVVNQPGFNGASFFKWIFIGSDIDSENTDLILQHEITHSRLGHSFDVMIGNLYQVVFWFNPLSWYLLRQIKINTELETDFAISKMVSVKKYGDLLLNLHQTRISYVLNSFSSSHLKIRIKAMTKQNSQKKWVHALPYLLIIISFLAVSCSDLVEKEELTNTELIVDQRLGDVKSITSKFISHQSDTHQKTGKLVSRVTFHPDGSLNEFINQTSYPYDHDEETKRIFWDAPLKTNLFHIMDGLHLGPAEKNMLYGNDWPTAYLKYLRDNRKGELQSRFWKEQITADREDKPTAITLIKSTNTRRYQA